MEEQTQTIGVVWRLVSLVALAMALSASVMVARLNDQKASKADLTQVEMGCRGYTAEVLTGIEVKVDSVLAALTKLPPGPATQRPPQPKTTENSPDTAPAEPLVEPPSDAGQRTSDKLDECLKRIIKRALERVKQGR